jgi:hypothetical protein
MLEVESIGKSSEVEEKNCWEEVFFISSKGRKKCQGGALYKYPKKR